MQNKPAYGGIWGTWTCYTTSETLYQRSSWLALQSSHMSVNIQWVLCIMEYYKGPDNFSVSDRFHQRLSSIVVQSINQHEFDTRTVKAAYNWDVTEGEFLQFRKGTRFLTYYTVHNFVLVFQITSKILSLFYNVTKQCVYKFISLSFLGVCYALSLAKNIVWTYFSVCMSHLSAEIVLPCTGGPMNYMSYHINTRGRLIGFSLNLLWRLCH
jgi:hypothetical protein